MSQSHLHNGVEMRIRKHSMHNNSTAEHQPSRKSESSEVARLTVPYRIKILNRHSENCTFCYRSTRIDGQIDTNKYGYISYNVCQGCSAKETNPIGLLIDLKKVYFSLDWNETLAFKTAAIRPT